MAIDIKKYNQEFLEDPSLQTMRAIKSKQLFYPNEGYIYNCSQDVIFGVQEIAHAPTAKHSLCRACSI